MEDKQRKGVNMAIIDGDSFFAHELSINFNPTQFVFDFKNVSPRIDPRSNDRATIVLKHNVVLMDPYHTKKVYSLLGEVVKIYESDYGKIDKPASVKKFEKRRKKDVKDLSKDKVQAPNYFG